MASQFRNLRSGQCLQEFMHYCITHPDQRFWQALRNWAGTNFIYASDESLLCSSTEQLAHRQDTFYWEGKTDE